VLTEGGSPHEPGPREAVRECPLDGASEGTTSDCSESRHCLRRRADVDEDHVTGSVANTSRASLALATAPTTSASCVASMRPTGNARRPFVLDTSARSGSWGGLLRGLHDRARPRGEDSSSAGRFAYWSGAAGAPKQSEAPDGLVPSGIPGPLSSTVQTSVSSSISRRHFDRAAVLARQGPVLDRVLDQRLQEQPGQKAAASGRRPPTLNASWRRAAARGSARSVAASRSARPGAASRFVARVSQEIPQRGERRRAARGSR